MRMSKMNQALIYADGEGWDDEDIDIVIIKDTLSDDGLLYEQQMAGLDEIVEDFRSQHLKPVEYYLVDYSFRTETESWEMPHIEYAYLDSWEFHSYPYWKGYVIERWERFKTITDEFMQSIASLPRRRWRYCALYGGAGLQRDKVFLWQAYWYKITRRDLGWGIPSETWVEKDGW